jgi:hypothetical protein
MDIDSNIIRDPTYRRQSSGVPQALAAHRRPGPRHGFMAGSEEIEHHEKALRALLAGS